MSTARGQLQKGVVAVESDGDVVLAGLHARLADGGEHARAGEITLVALLHGLSLVRNGLKRNHPCDFCSGDSYVALSLMCHLNICRLLYYSTLIGQ